MKYFFTMLSFLVVLFISTSSNVFAHCEIPCGIYGDEMRFEMWDEQISTVEKSMTEITRLSKEATANYNQIVRWVINKDKHADDIREIAVQYFLTQRIKPVDASDKTAYTQYQNKLEVLHNIIVQTMKAKQTTDLEHVQKLRELVAKFHDLYFSK